MSLRSVAERVVGTHVGEVLSSIQWMPSEDVPLGPVTCDPHQVKSGDIYVAIDSPRRDGHLQAAQAVERGARVIVVERLLPLFGATQYVVDDSQQAFAELCQALVGNPSDEIATIGVTGSHGKTSIAMLVDSILRAAGRRCCYQTRGWTSLEGQGARHLSPTSAPAIAEFLAESVASECQHAVIELGEGALRKQAAAGVTLDVLCISNIPADNAPRGRSRQAIRDTIGSSLQLLGEHGIAIFNAGDPAAVRLMSECTHPAFTFGIDCEAEVVGTPLEQHTCGQEFLLTIGDDTAVVETKIPGRAHLENCLAAAAVARVYGVSLIDIARGIEQLAVVPGVMQRFDGEAGVATYVDRGESPVARGSALSTARDVTQGKVIAVVNQACAVAQQLADHTLVTAGLLATCEIRQTVESLLAEFGLHQQPKWRSLVERMTGIALALQMAGEGDVVVISGTGHWTPNRVDTTGAIDEQLVVQTLIETFAHRKAA